MWNVSQHTQFFSRDEVKYPFLLDPTRSMKFEGEDFIIFFNFFVEHHFTDKTNRVDGFFWVGSYWGNLYIRLMSAF